MKNQHQISLFNSIDQDAISHNRFDINKVTEIQVSYRTPVRPSERPKISCSHDAYQILKKCYDPGNIEYCEFFKILLLNRANKVLGMVNISQDDISGTIADPKLIFSAALKCAASSIILSHNHPSGNLIPSEQDIKLTKRLKSGGELLEIQILDHIILSPDEGYYSFADEGLL